MFNMCYVSTINKHRRKSRILNRK